MLKNITVDGNRFRLNLNLQNLSMISIAAKLWDSQDIKSRIKNNLPGLDSSCLDENWREISKLVVQYANSINLPASFSVLLKKTILLIGEKIYHWIFYVTHIFGLDVAFTQKIYFRLGVVDEVKVFDLYWRDLMARGTFLYNSHYFSHSPLFSLACIYGCEKFVKERKNEMLEELSEFYPDIKTGDEIHNIMSVSICMTARKSILENVASPQRMFELCLRKGYSKAAKFYWEKLDEVEKVSNLTNFAKKCWGKHCDANFLREKDCENLSFLINLMGEEERSLFFTDYADEIIKLFLPIWPYQELILDLLKYDWSLESSRFMDLAVFLIYFSERMNCFEFPLDNELVFQIMQRACGNIQVDDKLSYLGQSRHLISSFFLTLNPEILNLFFNDPSITEVDRKEMDSLINEGFSQLVKMGKFDILNSLIETVFNFAPEPREILNGNLSNPWFVRELIVNDESFGLVDQFLDWSAESETERATLKKKINTISVCRSLTEERDGWFKFELADKFLRWMLESDGEVKRFKEEMKSYNFVIVVYSDYVRIKSGDLSWLSPGDSLVMHPDDDPFDNANGLTFLKIEDATELNRGVVLGIKSFGSSVDYDFLRPDGCHVKRRLVDFVGTKVGDFIVFNVRNIWNYTNNSNSTLDEAVKLSNAFIKFYYETDEEVLKFKKTKLHVLVSENAIQFLLDAFKGLRIVPKNFLDIFCEFCMIPSEKIEEIKIRQRSDIEKFLDTYLIDQRKFKFVEIYLNWLFGEVKKTEVCKKFLNSSNKGALLCASYFKNRRGVRPLNYRNLVICRWLCLVDDMEKLKNDVFALNEDTPEWFPALLDEAAHMGILSGGCSW